MHAWHWISSLLLVSRLSELLHQCLTNLLASSVDAERAFSGGRLQINHLQHGISSQTFKAQMAVGSWVGSDIFPTLEPFADIIRDASSRSQKGKGKEKEKAVPIESNDDTDLERKGDIAYD